MAVPGLWNQYDPEKKQSHSAEVDVTTSNDTHNGPQDALQMRDRHFIFIFLAVVSYELGKV